MKALSLVSAFIYSIKEVICLNLIISRDSKNENFINLGGHFLLGHDYTGGYR